MKTRNERGFVIRKWLWNIKCLSFSYPKVRWITLCTDKGTARIDSQYPAPILSLRNQIFLLTGDQVMTARRPPWNRSFFVCPKKNYLLRRRHQENFTGSLERKITSWLRACVRWRASPPWPPSLAPHTVEPGWSYQWRVILFNVFACSFYC